MDIVLYNNEVDDLYLKKGDSSVRVKESIDYLMEGNMTEILYDDLVALRDASGLTPGRCYRIVDYVTTTSQNNTRSAGNLFDIIVIADDVNKLNCNARAINHSGDTFFQNSDLSKWQISYDIDNNRDKYRWAVPEGGYIMATIDINEKKFLRTPTSDVEEAAYPYCWSKNSETWFTASETPAVNDVAYASSDGTGDSITIEEFCPCGTGVIYKMNDEFGNECPYDFKNIQYLRYFYTDSVLYRKNTIVSNNIAIQQSVRYHGTTQRFTINHIDGYGEIVIGYTDTPTGTYLNNSGQEVDLSNLGIHERFAGDLIVFPINSSTKYYCYTFQLFRASNNGASIISSAEGTVEYNKNANIKIETNYKYLPNVSIIGAGTSWTMTLMNSTNSTIKNSYNMLLGQVSDSIICSSHNIISCEASSCNYMNSYDSFLQEARHVDLNTSNKIILNRYSSNYLVINYSNNIYTSQADSSTFINCGMMNIWYPSKSEYLHCNYITMNSIANIYAKYSRNIEFILDGTVSLSTYPQNIIVTNVGSNYPYVDREIHFTDAELSQPYAIEYRLQDSVTIDVH